jgi:hypothetical protein
MPPLTLEMPHRLPLHLHTRLRTPEMPHLLLPPHLHTRLRRLLLLLPGRPGAPSPAQIEALARLLPHLASPPEKTRPVS